MLKQSALFAESWNVAWRNAPAGAILSDLDTPFQIIRNSIRYWAADPFVFAHEGRIFIFAELYDYFTRRGGIGYCEWLGSSFGPWKKVISEDFHLSYPFIFEANGTVWILPESSSDHSLFLYRAVSFPDTWERADVLRENVEYADTTPFIWNGQKYAISYVVADASRYAVALLDLDRPNHDQFLSSLDSVNTRRPAGKTFVISEKHYRPAQICIRKYGEALAFYQFELIGNTYREKSVGSVTPEMLKYSQRIYLDGIHTYNASNDFEVIDIKTRRFNLINFFSRIIGKLGR